MGNKKQNTVFVHAGTGKVIKREKYISNKVFFNKMYLLGDVLYDAKGNTLIENVLDVKEHQSYLEVENKVGYWLFDEKGKNFTLSHKKFEVFFNGWYAYFDENNVKKLINNTHDVIVTDFLEVYFYLNGWYTVKFLDEYALYGEDGSNIYTSPYEILVDDEHDRFIVCYNEDRISIFEKDLTPVILDVDAFISLENIYAIKRGDVIEIYHKANNSKKDKMLWRGSQDEFLSDVCIMDVNNDADVLVEQLLKSK